MMTYFWELEGQYTLLGLTRGRRRWPGRCLSNSTELNSKATKTLVLSHHLIAICQGMTEYAFVHDEVCEGAV